MKTKATNLLTPPDPEPPALPVPRPTTKAPRPPKKPKVPKTRTLTAYEIYKIKQSLRTPNAVSLQIREAVLAAATEMGFPGLSIYGNGSRMPWPLSIYEAHVVLCREHGISYPNIAISLGQNPGVHSTAVHRFQRVQRGQAAAHTMQLVEKVRREMASA